jgi:hypothetical protein
VFGRQRRRIDSRQGRFMLRLEPRERDLIRQLLGELREVLALPASDPRVRRLYPAAYAGDQEREDEYQRLTRDELTSGRLASVDAVEETIDKDLLTLEELTAWMQAVNSLRLVLGTMLEITEDGQEPAFAPSDPNARTVALYGYLGGLLDEIVEAQLNP